MSVTINRNTVIIFTGFLALLLCSFIVLSMRLIVLEYTQNAQGNKISTETKVWGFFIDPHNTRQWQQNKNRESSLLHLSSNEHIAVEY
ncbi:MAG: hypothetical protein COA90_06095 [Gammaproteobacteria bacterium]|nr:MAG: hypothetical protein COA90_06095 [Gammaproteobacteria bacterium]